MTKADAVVWSDSIAACVVRDSAVVEFTVVVTDSWKGIPKGHRAVVRVMDAADFRNADYPFTVELSERTGHTWPPADFLRRDKDGTYINDGCLTPLPPSDLESATEELTRLMPIPADRGVRYSMCSPHEKLSCTRLDQSVFQKPGEDIVAYYRAGRLKYETNLKHPHATQAPVRGPTRTGSCAGCTLSNRSTSPMYCVFAALLSAYVFRRTRKPASTHA